MRSRHRCCFAVGNSVCADQRRHRSGSGLGFPMGPLRPPGVDTVVACGFVAGSTSARVATPVAAPGEGRGAPARYYSPGTPPGTCYVMRARCRRSRPDRALPAPDARYRLRQAAVWLHDLDSEAPWTLAAAASSTDGSPTRTPNSARQSERSWPGSAEITPCRLQLSLTIEPGPGPISRQQQIRLIRRHAMARAWT